MLLKIGKVFMLEVHRWSLYARVPYVGACWIGGGQKASFDSWKTLLAMELRTTA